MKFKFFLFSLILMRFLVFAFVCMYGNNDDTMVMIMAVIIIMIMVVIYGLFIVQYTCILENVVQRVTEA